MRVRGPGIEAVESASRGPADRRGGESTHEAPIFGAAPPRRASRVCTAACTPPGPLPYPAPSPRTFTQPGPLPGPAPGPGPGPLTRSVKICPARGRFRRRVAGCLPLGRRCGERARLRGRCGRDQDAAETRTPWTPAGARRQPRFVLRGISVVSEPYIAARAVCAPGRRALGEGAAREPGAHGGDADLRLGRCAAARRPAAPSPPKT